MRPAGTTVALLALLLLGALCFDSFGAPELELPAVQPAASTQRNDTAPTTGPVPDPLVPSPDLGEPEPARQDARVSRCRPGFGGGEGPPLELRLTGADLPDVPPKSTRLEVAWIENGQPRKWFIRLSRWQTTFWLCDQSEVSVRSGAYRLRSQSVPRSGPVTLTLEKAAAPSNVTVRTMRLGVAIEGVRVRLTGCEPLVTGDGGAAVTSCEEVDEPRRAVVRAPWRSATAVTFAPDATEAVIAVLGSDEVEPGRIGAGFGRTSTTPVVQFLVKEGPAQQGGLKIGDEVMEVDGVGVSTVEETMRRIIGTPGSTLRLKIRRDKDVLLLDVLRSPPPQ